MISNPDSFDCRTNRAFFRINTNSCCHYTACDGTIDKKQDRLGGDPVRFDYKRFVESVNGCPLSASKEGKQIEMAVNGHHDK